MTFETTPSEDFGLPVPDKCKNCTVANLTIALSYQYGDSIGGPATQKQIIEDNCDGYEGIEDEETVKNSPTLIETDQGEFISFPVPRGQQLARCALRFR